MGKKKLSWIKDVKPTEWSKYCNQESILNGLKSLTDLIFADTHSSFIKLYASNIGQEREIHQNYIAPVSVNRAIKAGHTDLSLYLYVNPLRSTPLYDGKWTKAWFLSHNTENFVLDLDESHFETFDELVYGLMSRKCPVPKAIVKTSSNSFHLVYTGITGEWTEAKRFELVKRLSNCPLGLHEKQVEAHLKHFGIDVGYLKLKPASMKIRLPGTINYRKSNNLTGQISVTSLWINPEELKPRKLRLVKVTEKIIIVNRDRKYLYGVDKKIKFLTNKLAERLGEEDTAIFSEIFGSGWNKLFYDNCRILQERWAALFDIPQYDISRKLARMVKKGYLVVAKEYERGKYARTYGPGPVLKALMTEFMETQPRYEDYDINASYVPGAVNGHYLEDIRALAWRGYTESETISFIQAKQSWRPKKKQRTSAEIRQTYRRHVAWLRIHYRNWSAKAA